MKTVNRSKEIAARSATGNSLASKKNNYDTRKAERLCVICEEPLPEGWNKVRCPICHNKNKEDVIQRGNKRKANGCCPRCGVTLPEGWTKTTCPSCLEKQRDKFRAKKSFKKKQDFMEKSSLLNLEKSRMEDANTNIDKIVQNEPDYEVTCPKDENVSSEAHVSISTQEGYPPQDNDKATKSQEAMSLCAKIISLKEEETKLSEQLSSIVKQKEEFKRKLEEML